MLKISIPTPCHEDWNKMTPDETGRHCSSCAKSVVDFTGMSDDEVKLFFLNKKEDERVCGRFKQTQLHRITIELPQNIFNIQMPLWKKFLAACLVVFSTTLFSCETKINDKAMIKTEASDINNIRSDISGLLNFQPNTIPVPVETCKITAGKILVLTSAVPELKGMIEPMPFNDNNKTKIDTVPQPTKEVIFMGDSIYEEAPIKKPKSDSSSKTKNPPKADSANCNTIKNYN